MKITYNIYIYTSPKSEDIALDSKHVVNEEKMTPDFFFRKCFLQYSLIMLFGVYRKHWYVHVLIMYATKWKYSNRGYIFSKTKI